MKITEVIGTPVYPPPTYSVGLTLEEMEIIAWALGRQCQRDAEYAGHRYPVFHTLFVGFNTRSAP